MPYPPNYGGVIDVFYKIKSLHAIGIKIILHCFKYGREEQEILNGLCEAVYYYERKLNPTKLFSSKPFISITRNHPELLKNLLKDGHPILFEGLHSCFFLDNNALNQRYKMVRMHNIEWQYYKGLLKGEKSFVKKQYFNWELKKLKSYESILSKADKILTISGKDQYYYNIRFPEKTILLNCFHKNDTIRRNNETKPFCLYHGNLSVNENEQAALFLIETFKETNIMICFTGRNPSYLLKEKIKQFPNYSLIENPSDETLNELIGTASVNLLPFVIDAGAKIKLLNALFLGNFIISNSNSVAAFSSLIIEANSPEEWVEKTNHFMNQKFNEIDLNKRETILYKKYNNIENAKIITNLLP